MMSTTDSQLVTTWRLAAPRRFAEPGVAGRPTTTFAVVSAPFVEEFPNLLIRSQIGLSAVLTWEIAGWGRANRPELDAVLARAGALAGHHGAGFESLNADRSDLTPRKPGESGPGGQAGRERATRHQARGASERLGAVWGG